MLKTPLQTAIGKTAARTDESFTASKAQPKWRKTVEIALSTINGKSEEEIRELLENSALFEVKLLRKACEDRNLSVGGKRKELVQRLVDYECHSWKGGLAQNRAKSY